MTLLMTSPGHKIGQILKLIYLRQYLNYKVCRELKKAMTSQGGLEVSLYIHV